jgi:mono/diheme cytochrome c family protein
MTLAKTFFGLFLTATFALPAGDAKEGKASYDKACRTCHGADGAPNQAMVKMMKVEMRHLGDPEVQKATDSQMIEMIRKGTGKMKPVSSLNEKQAADAVAFVRTLKK